jgi:hypothetical protein
VDFYQVDVTRVMESPQSPDNIELGDGDALVVRADLRARRFPASIRLEGEFANPGI